MDFIYTTGQALSLLGLAYGWLLALSRRDDVRGQSDSRATPALLHHLAMA